MLLVSLSRQWSDQTFKINIDNHFSDLSKISCGPLLFLLYVNDMPQVVHSDLFLYADDSDLTFQHKDIYNWTPKDFTNLCEWFVDNKLRIHLGEEKTSVWSLS